MKMENFNNVSNRNQRINSFPSSTYYCSTNFKMSNNKHRRMSNFALPSLIKRVAKYIRRNSLATVRRKTLPNVHSICTVIENHYSLKTFSSSPPPNSMFEHLKTIPTIVEPSNDLKPIHSNCSLEPSSISFDQSSNIDAYHLQLPPASPTRKVIPVVQQKFISPIPIVQPHCHRLWLYNFLLRPKEIISYAYHIIVGLAIILGLMFFAFTTCPDHKWWSINALQIMDIVIVTILTIEYVLLLWASSSIGKFRGSGGRLRFILSPYQLINLLLIIISALILWTYRIRSTNRSYIKWLRCAQVVQLARIGPHFNLWRHLRPVLRDNRKEFLFTGYMCFVCLMAMTCIVYYVENDEQDTLFTSIPNSIYWGTITVLSIGYGDMAPVTTAGRFVTTILAIIGVTMYMIPTEVIAAGVAINIQEGNSKKNVNKRYVPAARLIQSTWRYYASKQNYASTWKRPKIPSARVSYRFLPRFDSRTRLMVSQNESIRNVETNSINETIELSGAEKCCLTFIRLLTLEVAKRKLRDSFRPYSVKDVLEQFSHGHSDLMMKMRTMQVKMDEMEYDLIDVNQSIQILKHQHDNRLDHLQQITQSMIDQLQDDEQPGYDDNIIMNRSSQNGLYLLLSKYY
ncbi:Potassium voltage-gated channel sub KQT member 4 [Blomia tropicalis]|nr:Potassium voltage-gated channel sub KQT member 4 [Blomia tropicalis]